MDKKITVVCTSCNRPEMLEKTLDSFFKYNTYSIEQFFVIDDSAVIGCNNNMVNKFPLVNFLYNKINIGQIESIDKIYKQITTPYIFHIEEDWQFERSGFIEACLDVIDMDDKIICVWVRHPNDTKHPLLSEIYISPNGYQIQKVSFNFLKDWHGFTFNPSLKRMKDYPKNGYLSLLDDYDNPREKEQEISKYYFSKGYYAMAFTTGYCKHIGYYRWYPNKTIF